MTAPLKLISLLVISKHNDELVGIKLKFDGGYESPFLGGVCNANLVEKEVNFNGSPLLKVTQARMLNQKSGTVVAARRELGTRKDSLFINWFHILKYLP